MAKTKRRTKSRGGTRSRSTRSSLSRMSHYLNPAPERVNENYRGALDEQDERHGPGVQTYRDGSKYEGEWVHGVRSGKGKMTYKNGDVYDGEWKNNGRVGKGTMTYTKKGITFEGEWRNNMRNGKGKMTYRDGDVYEGEWENDIRK